MARIRNLKPLTGIHTDIEDDIEDLTLTKKSIEQELDKNRNTNKRLGTSDNTGNKRLGESKYQKRDYPIDRRKYYSVEAVEKYKQEHGLK